jgi:hypothetical protein
MGDAWLEPRPGHELRLGFVFLSPSRKIPVRYLDYVMTISIQILRSLSYFSYYADFCILPSPLNNGPKCERSAVRSYPSLHCYISVVILTAYVGENGKLTAI